MTVSPWAIRTKATMSSGQGPPAPPFVGLADRNSPLPQRPTLEDLAPDPPAAPQPSTHNSSAPIAFYGEVIVTWEGAAPVQIARREPLGPEFINQYAIRITGLPAQTFMPETGRTPLIHRLLRGATLEPEGRKPQPSAYVLRLPDRKSLVFAFPRSRIPLGTSNRFIWFNLNLNQMMIRARFDLRLMTFRNLLAL